MNLSYTISPDRKTLTIHADEQARKELRELPETCPNSLSWTIHSDVALLFAFERLIANSELEWIAPEVCGDLTAAPILGILGPEDAVDDKTWDNGQGTVWFGHMAGCVLVHPVLERWAFMDYQVRSVLEDLRDKGQAVFVAP